MTKLNLLLLADASQGLNHEVSVVEKLFADYAASRQAELNIVKMTMEEIRINPKFMPSNFRASAASATKNIAIFWEKLVNCQLLYDPSILKIFIPHPEIIVPGTLPLLAKIDHFWHKTRLSEAAFKNIAPQAAHLFTGFTSTDPEVLVKGYTHFAHFRGKAANRHSTALLNVWRSNPHYPQLKYHFYQELSASWEEPFDFTEWLSCRNIRIMAGKIDKKTYYEELSECGLHLCLSGVEGFGHYINEARAMGAVAIVIDAPPMNEFIDPSCGILIKPVASEEMGLVRRHLITEREIKSAVDRIITLSEAALEDLGKSARKKYLAERQLFYDRCGFLLDLICA